MISEQRRPRVLVILTAPTPLTQWVIVIIPGLEEKIISGNRL
jgi:hypothetical protein